MEKETRKTEVAVEVLDKDGEVIENEYTVVFNKPYTFEGETYDKIDLSGLDNLTAADMIAANKILDRTGSFTFLPEMSLEYACIIAAKATKLPVGFFKGLHPKEAVKGQEPCDSFFLRSGISPTDGANLRKLAIQLSMTLRTGIDFFLSLSVFELREIAEEVADIGKQQQRAGTRH